MHFCNHNKIDLKEYKDLVITFSGGDIDGQKEIDVELTIFVGGEEEWRSYPENKLVHSINDDLPDKTVKPRE